MVGTNGNSDCIGWDLSGSFGGSTITGQTSLGVQFADTIGTTTDPKLTVTYAVPLLNPSYAKMPPYSTGG